MYWVYVNIFWCLRRVHKTFSEDYSVDMKKHECEWLCVEAVLSDASIVDVTDMIRNIIRNDATLTPIFLEQSLRMENVVDWYYLTKTLEYNKIDTTGVLNGL